MINGAFVTEPSSVFAYFGNSRVAESYLGNSLLGLAGS